MRNETSVRVHYPLERGQLLLRSDADWEENLEPVAENRHQGWFDFRLRFDGRFAYFKPIVVDPRGLTWARGENLLALPGGRAPLEVWPHFFEDSACSVCNVHQVGGDSGHAVRVFYPPGYAENTLESYPVLYMQDGQNLFFPDEAFGGQHWKVEETLGVLSSMNLIRKAIVVGVYPRDRMADYTRPGYETYGRFVVDELKPWVERSYRTLPGREHNAVIGSSLGGVVSFYLGWQYPELFGAVGAMSATFGFHDDLAERVASEPRRPLRVYLDTGWPRDNYEVNRSLRRLLIARGYVEGADLLYLAFPEAAHNEQAWAMRAHVPFQYFFGRIAEETAAAGAPRAAQARTATPSSSRSSSARQMSASRKSDLSGETPRRASAAWTSERSSASRK